MKLLLLAAAVIFHFSFFIFHLPKAYADVSCQPIYGGGEACASSPNISIDKKVLNPQTNKMVDNLGINDPKYKPDFIVNFQIKIVNTGKDILTKVEIKDIFPQHMAFSAGPGSLDEDGKTLSFEAKNLKPNEAKVYAVVGKISRKDSLPQETTCATNQVTAIINNDEKSQDIAQFCIENSALEPAPSGFPVFPAENIRQTPATGSSISALFLIPIGILGWTLRKFDLRRKYMI